MNFPQRLIEGYAAFLAERLPREQSRFRELAETGQKPEIMVIGCCNSRVSPEVIFDARPGELFVVRNVANIMPPYAPDGQAHGVSAALEFGVGALKRQTYRGARPCPLRRRARICRRHRQLRQPLSPGDFIGKWMALIAPAADKVGPRGDVSLDDYQARLEQANIVNSLDNLMTFPRRQADREGQDRRARRLFRRGDGGLSVLDRGSGEFRSAKHELAAPRF